jgi:hypothetical protein
MAARHQLETSSHAANLRRVAAELRRSTPFRGLLALVAVKKFSGSKGLARQASNGHWFATDSIAA